MNDFAIINTTCGQYLVREGDIINLDLGTLAENDAISFDVMLLSKKGAIKIGDPFVSKVKVKGTVVGNVKGKKLDILTFKAKSRYRKHQGHRQEYTQVKIDSI